MFFMKRSGIFKGSLILVILVVFVGAAVYFGFTNQGNVDLRMLKEKFEKMTQEVKADKRAILAAENLIKEFDVEKEKKMREYTIEKTDYEKTKKELEELAEQYNKRKEQEEILNVGLEKTKEQWENNKSITINIAGQTLTVEKHIKNLNMIRDELSRLNELYQITLEKAEFQKNNVQLLSDTINKIDRDKKNQETQIERGKVILAKNEKMLDQFGTSLKNSKKSSYAKLLEQCNTINEAFNQAELEMQTIKEFSNSIPDYSVSSSSIENSEINSSNVLPERLDPNL